MSVLARLPPGMLDSLRARVGPRQDAKGFTQRTRGSQRKPVLGAFASVLFKDFEHLLVSQHEPW
jgi:hypothetical protein